MFVAGENFPGDQHRERIRRYTEHRRMLRSMYDAAQDIRTLLGVMGTTDYLVGIKRELLEELAGDIRVIANLPRTICRRLAGMVNSGMVLTSESAAAAEAIEAALKASTWSQRKRQITYRALAYGNGLMTTRRTDGGAVIIDQRDPWTWFPEVSLYDPSRATAHTFAWIVTRGDDDYLLQEHHEPGRIVRLANVLDGTPQARDDDPVKDARLGKSASWSDVLGLGAPAEIEETNYTAPLVAVVQSWTDEDSPYGVGLLTGNETLIYEVTARLSQIATILDKHAAPKLQGPEAAMKRSPNTGLATFDVRGSRYWPRESKDDPEFSYVTWESQLEHAHQELDRVIALMCIQMDMTPELLGLDVAKTANAAEATATLRMRSFGTIQAVDDHRAFHRVGMEEVGRQIIALSGISGAEPSVDYGDALPPSQGERAALIQTHRMAGVMSLETAIEKLNPDWTPDQIEAEVERLRAEEAGLALNPGQA